MSQTKRVPKRSEVPVEDTWRLEDIYATPADWEKEAAALAELGVVVNGRLQACDEHVQDHVDPQESGADPQAVAHGFEDVHLEQQTHYDDGKGKENAPAQVHDELNDRVNNSHLYFLSFLILYSP